MDNFRYSIFEENIPDMALPSFYVPASQNAGVENHGSLAELGFDLFRLLLGNTRIPSDSRRKYHQY